MTQQQIAELVAALADFEPKGPVFNPYGWSEPDNQLRRDNLTQYLSRMALLKPKVLLVSEAPGYNGCRLTGVPFTSEHTMMGNAGHALVFPADAGYRVALPTRENSRAAVKLSREPSGTILWQILADFETPPLIWNAYPFHPHKPDIPLSNRAPTSREIADGGRYLRMVIEFAAPQVIVAVGNVGSKALSALGIEHEKVRHPSQGGKRDFIAGIARILRDDAE